MLVVTVLAEQVVVAQVGVVAQAKLGAMALRLQAPAGMVAMV